LARMNAVQREEKAEATRASMPGTGIVAGAVARRQPALAAGMLRYSALDPLHTGGPIRLRFDSPKSGWLYVLVAEREGWRLVASDQIEAGRLRVVSVRFDEPGRKELLAIVSRTEQSDLRQDKISVPPAAAASLRIILEITRP
ncbi:MAG TPA: hypothetical protein VN442_07010, partial [Bryobacteraceae bacterium]|nr:hypothetical protein [Bryobacteraceae bacterium]